MYLFDFGISTINVDYSISNFIYVYIKNTNMSIFISYLFVNRKVEISKKSNKDTSGMWGTMWVKDRYIKVILLNILSLNVECLSCKNKIQLLLNLFLKYSMTDNCFDLFCNLLILLVIKIRQLALLDPWLLAEGSYELGSILPSFHPSVLPSFCPSV